jgi:alanyl-tRNA synthetase
LIYCGITLLEKSVKIFIFSGDEAQKNGVRANVIARSIATTLGGSGGGDSRFGQGGGNRITNINKLEDSLKNIISLHIKSE